MRIIAAMTLTVAAAVPTAAATRVYVSVPQDQRIIIYDMDETSGALTRTGGQAVNGTPGSLCVDPERRWLFAALRSSKTIASFEIDPATGLLTHRSTTTPREDPAFVGADRTGRWLLSAYYGAGKVAVHRIDGEGRLEPEGTWTSTVEKAHCILTDRSNRFAFVPHTAPEKIFQFRFDVDAGRLQAADPPVVETPAGSGPRHVWFHPTLDVVYIDNEQGSSVTRYTFDPAVGTLAARETATTLPAGFGEVNSTADVRCTPDGRFLYVSNRGHDSLAGFALDAEGKMTPLGQFPTEATPRSFDIAPGGRFLYAAGQSSGKLAAYRIPDDGRLERFATYDVGPAAFWVMAVGTGAAGE